MLHRAGAERHLGLGCGLVIVGDSLGSAHVAEVLLNISIGHWIECEISAASLLSHIPLTIWLDGPLHCATAFGMACSNRKSIVVDLVEDDRRLPILVSVVHKARDEQAVVLVSDYFFGVKFRRYLAIVHLHAGSCF